MKTKGEITSEFILQKVAPVFNRKGYVGTSLSDLTNATGLTKGAIYGNFENKEELAVKAFRLNIKKAIEPLSVELKQYEKAVDQLYALTKYYRKYYDVAKGSGGCPILNVGSDANNINPKLFKAVKEVSLKLTAALTLIIQNGITQNEINRHIDASFYAKTIYSMIEGSVFMAFMHSDKSYISAMMDVIDNMIEEKLKK